MLCWINKIVRYYVPVNELLQHFRKLNITLCQCKPHPIVLNRFEAQRELLIFLALAFLMYLHIIFVSIVEPNITIGLVANTSAILKQAILQTYKAILNLLVGIQYPLFFLSTYSWGQFDTMCNTSLEINP